MDMVLSIIQITCVSNPVQFQNWPMINSGTAFYHRPYIMDDQLVSETHYIDTQLT
jgi:hypothetical protein